MLACGLGPSHSGSPRQTRHIKVPIVPEWHWSALPLEHKVGVFDCQSQCTWLLFNRGKWVLYVEGGSTRSVQTFMMECATTAPIWQFQPFRRQHGVVHCEIQSTPFVFYILYNHSTISQNTALAFHPAACWQTPFYLSASKQARKPGVKAICHRNLIKVWPWGSGGGLKVCGLSLIMKRRRK